MKSTLSLYFSLSTRYIYDPVHWESNSWEGDQGPTFHCDFPTVLEKPIHSSETDVV